jgi:3-dehydroquinate synthase
MEDSQMYETLFKIASSSSSYNIINCDSINDVKVWIDSIKQRKFVVIDKKIAKLYPQIIQGSSNFYFEIEACEENKTLEFSENIIKRLIEFGFRKNDILIAVGGGMIQDLTGFIASVIYRGVDWMFIPTTLVSQSDSCIGGKTSINVGGFKNLVGTFYPPTDVIICSNFLKSLCEDDMKSGVGEMLHYFILFNDESSINEVNDNYQRIINHQFDLTKLTLKSLLLKKPVIERDEKEIGDRKLFNYGHTFGHAIEAFSNFQIPHGIAVSIGMNMSNFVAWKLGRVDEIFYLKYHNLLKNNSLIFNNNDIDLFISLMKKDKKNTTSGVSCILPGNKFEIVNVTPENLLKVLKEYEKFIKNE